MGAIMDRIEEVQKNTKEALTLMAEKKRLEAIRRANEGTLSSEELSNTLDLMKKTGIPLVGGSTEEERMRSR
jgi:hypothetical protein